MRKIVNFLFGLALCHSLQAQSITDTVLQQYAKATKPAEKGRVLAESLKFRENPSQQTLGLLLQLNAYFKEQEDEIGSDYTSLFIASIFERFGNFQEALKLVMPLLPRFEERRDTFGILRSYLNIGNSIINSENVEQGLAYYKKAIPIAFKFNDTVSIGTLLNNIADGYKRMGKMDSALLYAQNAIRITEQYGNLFSLSTHTGTLGEIYLAKNDLEIGRSIVKKSIGYALASNNRHTLAAELNELARSYFTTRDSDSSIKYAQAALVRAYPDFKVIMMESYETLYKNYEQKGQGDSSFKYFRLNAWMKDSLFSSEKNRNIQVINFREQLREQEVKEALEKQKVQRWHNLQYSAIAVGLVTFVIFLLLASRYATNVKFIRFLSILGLLAVFEFINLFIHPYLDRLTNHSPVMMLFILMCIAALLIPLHHKLEHWIIHKLVEKNNRVRLLAAKKTIAQLEGKVTTVEKSPGTP